MQACKFSLFFSKKKRSWSTLSKHLPFSFDFSMNRKEGVHFLEKVIKTNTIRWMSVAFVFLDAPVRICVYREFRIKRPSFSCKAVHQLRLNQSLQNSRVDFNERKYFTFNEGNLHLPIARMADYLVIAAIINKTALLNSIFFQFFFLKRRFNVV